MAIKRPGWKQWNCCAYGCRRCEANENTTSFFGVHFRGFRRPFSLPTPQYVEPVDHQIILSKEATVAIILNNQRADKMRLAAETLRAKLMDSVPALRVRVGSDAAAPDVQIRLWDFSQDANPPVVLTVLDRELLSPGDHYGQGYVLRTTGEKHLWIIGASPQAVLYGATTTLQLISRTTNGAVMQGAYIRDYPDFEFRAASDWLLNIEINGWTWDRGQGVEAFAKLMESKIDRALQYKINMALVDGFGFSVAKRPAFYAPADAPSESIRASPRHPFDLWGLRRQLRNGI